MLETEAPAVTGRQLHAFIKTRLAAGEQLYGIADSARDPKLARIGWSRFGLQRWSLFPPSVDPRMSTVAPWLVTFGFRGRYPYSGSDYLEAWSGELGNSAGILLTTSASPRDLWEHLRDVFQTEDEEGREYFFRYYDPRVLRLFLPTCCPVQTRQLFGPITQLFVESESPGEMIVYTPGEQGPRNRSYQLDTQSV